MGAESNKIGTKERRKDEREEKGGGETRGQEEKNAIAHLLMLLTPSSLT